ncbi:hypothetical protein H9Q10_11070 [Eikenella sp. S3360]|uniref:Uncharacterized protein n=1 Tax=Eikenella glucosivorans TaxID=2766967 RepID=A0ABS0ND78_9NEIS|nr:hypothetical protein [Eikenella glucosivorans]MBH5330204.1 hypothetical protein [Eikenella glucosivorans]
MQRSSLFLPVLLIIFGAIWFLSSTDILPTTATLVALALAAGGIALLLLDGINTQSIVHGPMLMYLGAAIYLRNQMYIGFAPLAALGMMLLGGLMLLARSGIVPRKYGAHGLPRRARRNSEQE